MTASTRPCRAYCVCRARSPLARRRRRAQPGARDSTAQGRGKCRAPRALSGAFYISAGGCWLVGQRISPPACGGKAAIDRQPRRDRAGVGLNGERETDPGMIDLDHVWRAGCEMAGANHSPAKRRRQLTSGVGLDKRRLETKLGPGDQSDREEDGDPTSHDCGEPEGQACECDVEAEADVDQRRRF